MNAIAEEPVHEHVKKQAPSPPEITSIVHDLRNPLSAIQGNVEMLIGSELSDLQVRRIARNMHGASLRMKQLLDEFLSRYKGMDQVVESCDLAELVTSAVDKIALLAEAQSVRIDQDVPADLVLTLDRRRIQRVLVNLFVNALEVMPSGGSIRVSAVRERGSVLITVRDTGPGIASEIQGRLFQPFATVGKAGGLGLGLAFVRQAIIDHGGLIWAETDCSGACFAFCLPMARQRSVSC
jgi:signal transduction histidine kinase